MVAKKRVLVVDDNDIVCSVIAKVLDKRGADVVIAHSGKSAKKALHKFKHFDAVILDLIMPYASGWDILNLIRSNADTAHTPVIIFSGATISSDEKAKLAERADAFVDKETFNLAQFENTLDELLPSINGTSK